MLRLPVFISTVWVLSSLKQLRRRDRQLLLSSSENGGLTTERACESVNILSVALEKTYRSNGVFA